MLGILEYGMEECHKTLMSFKKALFSEKQLQHFSSMKQSEITQKLVDLYSKKKEIFNTI